MKKIFTLLTTAAMLCNMFAVTSFAEESDKPTSNTAITAAKTVQRMICVFTVGQDGKRRHIWGLNCRKISMRKM